MKIKSIEIGYHVRHIMTIALRHRDRFALLPLQGQTRRADHSDTRDVAFKAAVVARQRNADGVSDRPSPESRRA